MISAITNIGRNFVANNISGGAWFSITHFSLAWVTNEERTINSPRAEMIDFVTQKGNKANGDIIYNIWQTAFQGTEYNNTYGILNSVGETSFTDKWKYEYDDCNERNTLTNLDTDTVLIGAYNTDTGYVEGNLSVANMPTELKSANITKYPGMGYCDRLFPIKSFNVVKTSEDVVNASNTIVSYTLELPVVNSSDSLLELEGIGNFKFNRIGLYVTKSSGTQGRDSVSLTPIADEEPVLFAVIDLTTSTACNPDAVLDIYKTRESKGLSGWKSDVQLNISNTANLLDTTPLFRDSIRDDATSYYLSLIEQNAQTSSTLLDLQQQIINLTRIVRSQTSIDSLISNKGFNGEVILSQDNQLEVGFNDKKENYIFNAENFKSVDGLSTNNSNYIFTFTSPMETNNYSREGSESKIIISNLDGRKITSNDVTVNMWGGKIVFAKKNYYNASLDESGFKIYEINSSMLPNKESCSVSLSISFHSSQWILTSVSIF